MYFIFQEEYIFLYALSEMMIEYSGIVPIHQSAWSSPSYSKQRKDEVISMWPPPEVTEVTSIRIANHCDESTEL